MLLIGDIHGHFDHYFELLDHANHVPSLQVGDLGLGFGRIGKTYSGQIVTLDPDDSIYYDEMEGFNQHRFIRGNHDNPEVCKESPYYLGDYGMHELGFFYLGGAVSIDRYCQGHLSHLKMKPPTAPPANCYSCRTEGVNFWENEELSDAELTEAINLYIEEKPEVVVTHECPSDMNEFVGSPPMRPIAELYGRSRTAIALQMMYNAHQPKVWIFGHYHKRKKINTDKTRFECLDMLYYERSAEQNFKKACLEVPEIPDWVD